MPKGIFDYVGRKEVEHVGKCFRHALLYEGQFEWKIKVTLGMEIDGDFFNKAVYTAYVAPSRPKKITGYRPSDRPTDTTSYRVASSRQKKKLYHILDEMKMTDISRTNRRTYFITSP